MFHLEPTPRKFLQYLSLKDKLWLQFDYVIIKKGMFYFIEVPYTFVGYEVVITLHFQLFGTLKSEYGYKCDSQP